jgi:MoxR-like ATPase
MEFKGSDNYYLNPELKLIVNIAMQMDKPLLLTGEPGTGKTQLAFEISRSLNMPLEILRAKSTIKGEEACYVQDTVLRLNDARFGSEKSNRDVNQFFDYVIWGPIGRAFRSEERVVLLLDEIDKTESDVQDNLLDVLDEKQFTIREVNQVIKAKHNPLIIITSNAKRELSDPFLRRCFCHHLAFPARDEMIEIIKLHFPSPDPVLLDTALNIFYELRARGFEKAPATSELLDWLQAIQSTQTAINVPDQLPFIGTLLKRTEDILAFRKRNNQPKNRW